jgi:hypothetical protein
MLSGKLIHLIESRWDSITAVALQQIRTERVLTHIAALPDIELREWAEGILHNLGRWMSQDNREEVGLQYEALGRLRFEEGVPLVEAVQALCTLKAKVFDFIHSQGSARNTTEIYAEEEFEILVGRFFDYLIVSLVRGYETELRHAANIEAAIRPAARVAGHS